MKQQNNTEQKPLQEGVKKQKVVIKQDVDGHTIFYGETRIFKMAWDSYDKAKKWAEEADYEVIGGIERAIQDKGNGHTPGEIKTGSKLPGDEYKCCILNEDGRLLAQTFFNPYYDLDTAEANAARIVECWNNYDQLKAANKELIAILKRVKDVISLKNGVKVFGDEFENELKEAIQKHSK